MEALYNYNAGSNLKLVYYTNLNYKRVAQSFPANENNSAAPSDAYFVINMI